MSVELFLPRKPLEDILDGKLIGGCGALMGIMVLPYGTHIVIYYGTTLVPMLIVRAPKQSVRQPQQVYTVGIVLSRLHT